MKANKQKKRLNALCVLIMDRNKRKDEEILARASIWSELVVH
jgi:hypothetical protein